MHKRHECLHINNKAKSATLTFEIEAWFNPATHRLDMFQTHLPYYFKILPCIKELQPGHESMHVNTETASVTLTFEIWTRHVVMIRTLLVPNYFKVILCIKLLQPGHEKNAYTTKLPA